MLLVRGAVDTDQLQVPDRRRVCIRGVVLKKKWGGRSKQDLDKNLQLHRILILLY